MKPWKICINKKNSYKIDVRELINTNELNILSNKLHISYDFINKKMLKNKFICKLLQQ